MRTAGLVLASRHPARVKRLATMASELTELLLPMFGIEPGEMWFMFDNPVRDDVLALAAEYRLGEIAGTVYPNEYRHVLGLEALPDDVNRLRYRQVEPPAPMTPLFDNPPPKPDASKTASVDTEDTTKETNAETETETDTATKSAASCGHGKCCTCGGHGAVVSGAAGVDVADTRNGERSANPAVDCKSEPELTTKTLAGGIEWDDIAGVPKATVRIMSAFSTEVATWYAATIPTMVNDRVTPPAVMTPDAAAGVASANTSGFTDGYYPLSVIVTASGEISTNTDRRPWIDTKGGSGGTQRRRRLHAAAGSKPKAEKPDGDQSGIETA